MLALEKLSKMNESCYSRLLNSTSVLYRDLVSSRIRMIEKFLSSHYLKPVYLILDETVIKKYGKYIGGLNKFYSTIENMVIKGVCFLQCLMYNKSKPEIQLKNGPGRKNESVKISVY
ncbi:hypothetical protein OSSY52_11810 [Tepiditoga spiralis]|uniref:Uncharacterized protein n=1 Tax=Tepiditoga spiralis TaxID=2108365 RepID=A0A7G1G3N3_9BACT|nr:hypothetical protein OSSY52_11810 [Tepiditoga spiralis]